MKIYREIFIILLFSFLGEVASKLSGLPVPGSVIGMLLLFLALCRGVVRVEQVEAVGKFLVENLTILFVPAGIGVMLHFDLIAETWWILLLILGVTAALCQVAVGLTVQFVKRRYETPAPAVADNATTLILSRKFIAEELTPLAKIDDGK
ncbi:murein hydrolase regulator LrgA [Planctomycetales bacterium]|nr:murein hydrolase regulator LrgA [Planctomycetales bacterium]GHS98098.1 murein hydrolase regulator LrgA [Planctomycetales bacterium]GHT05387.1 murein hydrolase regulator LrgA [Planctomycetales bacterium]